MISIIKCEKLESKGFSKESIDSVRSIMNDNKDINSDERRESI